MNDREAMQAKRDQLHAELGTIKAEMTQLIAQLRPLEITYSNKLCEKLELERKLVQVTEVFAKDKKNNKPVDDLSKLMKKMTRSQLEEVLKLLENGGS